MTLFKVKSVLFCFANVCTINNYLNPARKYTVIRFHVVLGITIHSNTLCNLINIYIIIITNCKPILNM